MATAMISQSIIPGESVAIEMPTAARIAAGMSGHTFFVLVGRQRSRAPNPPSETTGERQHEDHTVVRVGHLGRQDHASAKACDDPSGDGPAVLHGEEERDQAGQPDRGQDVLARSWNEAGDHDDDADHDQDQTGDGSLGEDALDVTLAFLGLGCRCCPGCHDLCLPGWIDGWNADRQTAQEHEQQLLISKRQPCWRRTEPSRRSRAAGSRSCR